MKKNIIAIAGGGHAGIEAALALSRIKVYSLLVTMDKNSAKCLRGIEIKLTALPDKLCPKNLPRS